MVHDQPVQGGGGLDALHHQGVQGPAHAGQGFGAVAAVGDELGHHGIVEGGDHRVLVHGGVQADAGAAGKVQGGDAARGGGEAERVLGVDPALDGTAAQEHVLLGIGELAAGGDADLFLDDVHPAHHLGDRVLHLDPGVHFHEEEVAPGVQQELDGAGVEVADGLGGLDGGVPDALAQVRGQGRAGALFDQLLVPALDRALALAQVDDVAEQVAQDLHLNVPGLQQVLLHVDRVVGERSPGLGAGGVVHVGHLFRRVHHPHAAAAAAGAGLDDDRIADALAPHEGLFHGLHQPVAAGHERHPRRQHGGLGPGLVAHGADDLGVGADEDHPAGLAHVHEVGILAEKAVAGMDGFRSGHFRGGDDLGDVQVGFAAGGRADADVLVGETHVEGVAVGFGIDSHGLDAQFLAGQDHPQGDLAPVGDEHLAERRLADLAGGLGVGRLALERGHRTRTAKMRSPYSTG